MDFLYDIISSIETYRSQPIALHEKKVATYSNHLAHWIDMPESYCQMLHLAASLHDLGKIGIPEKIINKPGPLTLAEYETIKTHTTIEHEILSVAINNPQLHLAANIALYHHENFDDTGSQWLKG